MLKVLSLGAGVQSTTLALMVARGEFEPLDAAIFADTQWEPDAVYQHLAWLETQLPFPVLRVSIGNLRSGILARRTTSAGRYAPIPWFTVNPDGSHGMGRRQCTHEYKLKPISREIRRLLGVGPTARIPPASVEQWIGISRDEASRMKPAKQQYILSRWPLIERFMSREDCLRWLGRHGYPVPPKSACLGCPYRSPSGWRAMQAADPAGFADAVAIDAALRVGEARGVRGVEFMHPARIPLAEAVAASQPGDAEPNLFENECEGMCGV
jgi:hypothetical protein